MPTTGDRFEDKLIELFMSVYDENKWAGDLSVRTSPEKLMDGGVELVATRKSDKETLAIEHTLIEPFVGDKSDFHKHFKELALALNADESLKVTNTTTCYVTRSMPLIAAGDGLCWVLARCLARRCWRLGPSCGPALKSPRPRNRSGAL